MTTTEQIRALALQGVSRRNAEATIGHPFDADELQAYRAAATVRQLRKIADRNAPKSGADRVAAWTARRNDVGEIPPPRHPRLKERCRYDFPLFLKCYLRSILDHAPSADLKAGMIADAKQCALCGGLIAVLSGRGCGKTTIIDIGAALWVLLYGLRQFVSEFGASLKASLRNLKTVKRLLLTSPELLADFPAICIPIRAIGGVAQRAAAQTYHGRPTEIEWGSDLLIFPMLRDDLGQPLDAGCGAILSAIGIGGAIRGINIRGRRPDMVLIDDPQTRKIAASPTLVKQVLDYIHSDILGLAGHGSSIACFLTITPQRFGDVATEISSQAKHPEWDVRVQPFIKTLPPNWEQLALLFTEKYAEDMGAKEYDLPRSTAWYLENRALFEKMQTIDAEQYDHAREVDVCHHMLNLRAKMGKAAFDAEIMMKVVDAASEIQIDADRVASALNGAPRGVLPPGTDTVVGFCDINIRAGAGLSWVLVAFGPRRTAAVIDYGRYPADGSPLVPPNSSDLVRNRRVAAGIRDVVSLIANRRIRDAKGRAVRVRALGFDRGWLPDVLHRALYVIRKRTPVGFPIVAMRGFPWNKFGTRKEDMLRRGDHVFATRSRYGEYLAYMAPYWREVMQSGLLETPGMEGSLSLFGCDASVHFQFATEICAEKLVRKYQVYGGRETTTAWDWMTIGAEHFCDAVTGAFALASWFRAYDALSTNIDAAALGVKEPRQAHQDDLFDPMKNSALVAAYDATSDDTEGTGEKIPPRPEERDLEADLDDGIERPDYPGPKFKTVNSLTQSPQSAQSAISRRAAERQRALRKLAKFKKGKWRK